jgi:PSP
MQRYGPPPAYPNLKIPGVNCPIPESVTYGYGRLFTDEKGFTVYADCHGLNKAVYQRRQNRRPHWGQIGEAPVEELEEEDESEEEEEEYVPEYEGIGRNNLPDLAQDDIYEEQERLRQDSYQKVNLDDLKSGIQSLIQGSATLPGAAASANGQAKKPLIRPPTMPPLPTEVARPLYEIIPEVKNAGASASEIYASGHGYALPSTVNIQKTIETAQKGDAKEEKKKDDKKDKYKVKF